MCGSKVTMFYCVTFATEAGVQFATAGDLKAGVGGFDLGARDYRMPDGRSALLNPDKHCFKGQNTFDRCYTVCPLDYFTKELTRNLKYSTGKLDSPDLSCNGDLFFDVEGTAQGYWFGKNPGRNDYGPEHMNLYFGPNTFNPAQVAISIGNSVPGIVPMVYPFMPQHTGLIDRDPGEVTADGNVYCYNGRGRHEQENIAILVQLMYEKTLRVGKYAGEECGSGPWAFGEYAEFER